MANRHFATTAALATIAPLHAGETTKRKAGANARRRPARRETALLGAVALLFAAAIAIARSGWYTAESDLSYWLGVAGGVAMLALFAYPLRKRWRAMREIGSTRFWFALHMSLGIAGPLLIVLHSTLALGSLNATIAFASMAVVAASGIVGRYLYGRIHNGLYGRRETLAELRAQAGIDSAALHSKLALLGPVETRLVEFARLAEAAERAGLSRPLRFMTLGVRAMLARRWCVGSATRSLCKLAEAQGWTDEKRDRRIAVFSTFIGAYLQAVQRVAQFGVFERLFSWWHVLHVPLVFMLVLSAIAHVVAVHMY